MIATLLLLADDLVTALNERDWPLPFQAERAYAPITPLAEIGELQVRVVPLTVTAERAARGAVQYTGRLSVLVQGRVGAGGETPPALDQVRIDELLEVVSEIETFLRGDYEPGSGAEVLEIAVEPLYMPTLLHQERVFTSLLTVTCTWMMSTAGE